MKPASYSYNVGLAYAAKARELGDAPALRFPHGTVSYRELDALANQMSQLFAARGLGRHDAIAIVHTKSARSFAAMLGALKLGAAYVCLDEQNPAARARHILTSSLPKLVVGESLRPAVQSAAESQAIAPVSYTHLQDAPGPSG